jgi:hypothetical protein
LAGSRKLVKLEKLVFFFFQTHVLIIIFPVQIKSLCVAREMVKSMAVEAQAYRQDITSAFHLIGRRSRRRRPIGEEYFYPRLF